jgi:thiamine-monophosphate kinase
LLRQLRPQARVEWGELLGARRLATAMIDISDGLSSDLRHLCLESRVGALIEASRVPVNPFIRELRDDEFDPLALALHGGEDFELLFTVSPRNLKRLPREVRGVPVTYLGDVTNLAGHVMLAEGTHRRRLGAGGFSHF